MRALVFLLVDKYTHNNKKKNLGRILSGLQLENVENKCMPRECWMEDVEILAIREFFGERGVTVLVFHENDIKSYIEPFEFTCDNIIIMIHSYSDLHFSGTIAKRSQNRIRHACKALCHNYNMNIDFTSFFNKYFEIIPTAPDGHCGYHALIGSIIHADAPISVTQSILNISVI
jgi:hypothetical protein